MLGVALVSAAAPAWAASCYGNYRGIVTNEPFIPGNGYALGDGGECAYADTKSGQAYEYPSGSGRFAVPSNSIAINSTAGSPPQTPPSVRISGDAIGYNAFVVALAAKSYQVFLSPLQSIAASLGVPVSLRVTSLITAMASSSSGGPLTFDVISAAPAYSTAELLITNNGAAPAFFEDYQVQGCAYFSTGSATTPGSCAVNSLQTNSSAINTNVPVTYGGSALIRMVLVGRADGTPFSGPSSFSAFADPYIWIDPSQLIDVNGELIPANQLYTLVGDTEVNFLNSPDPTYVPLPAAIWQLSAGILLFLARVKRRR